MWKGPAQKRLRIYTRIAAPHCAYTFEAGKRYLVYAKLDSKRFSNRYRASVCSTSPTYVVQQWDPTSAQSTLAGRVVSGM